MSTYPELILVGNLYEHADLVFPGFTTNGNHVPNSWHYRDGGDAVDWDAHNHRYENLNGLASYYYHWSGLIVELFSTTVINGVLQHSGHYVKNGVRQTYQWAVSHGLATMGESGNHGHVAVATEVQVQEMLTRATQMSLGLTEDGVKGPKTTAAIKAVQKAAGLTEDDVVGTLTVAAIRKHNGWKPTY